MSQVPRAALIAAAVLAAGGPAFSQVEPAIEAAPERVLVAPLPAAAPGGGGPPDPLLEALPALLAEAISADGAFTACLAHDLAPSTLEAAGLDPKKVPEAASLASPEAAEGLVQDGFVRILALPSVEAAAGAAPGSVSYKLALAWRDLVADKSGRAAESGTGADLIGAAGRAAAAARRGWSAAFKPKPPPKGAAAPPRPLGEITSRTPSALAAWARAGASWARGDVPGAEAALAEALAADAGFGRARADLAWIRLAQERREEAAALASEALKGKRLSPAARLLGRVVEAAGRGDPNGLLAAAGKVEAEAPGSPWGPLGRGIALNQQGDHDPAVALLDQPRMHRPNDPAILHQSGIAALGAGDPAEATAHLERAASLWPRHDRIQIDLAEARVRNRDLEGARRGLAAWRDAWDPMAPPVWGGSYTTEAPPPPVLAVGVGLLNGAAAKAIEEMTGASARLEEAGAPVSTRLALLHALHTLQAQLTFGEELARQRWLNAARDSFRTITELTPPDEKERRPWVLARLEALLRVREGRIAEARQLREKVLAASGLPGYDPGIEAEIEAAITLKAADQDGHLGACRRAVEVRGSLADHYHLGQAYSMLRKWKEVDAEFATMAERMETWSAARRREALLASPEMALLVPFAYSLGGEAGWWLGDVDKARSRWGLFLAYFRTPDEPFRPYRREAVDTGATPAW